MDFSRFCVLTVAVVVLCFGVLTHQMPQEAAAEAASTANEIVNGEANSATAESQPVSKNCTTSKGLNGACIQRQSCDYSTYAVDLTLYAPHGYVRTCTTEEVCCPFDSMVRVDADQNFNESEFDFEDGD